MKFFIFILTLFGVLALSESLNQLSSSLGESGSIEIPRNHVVNIKRRHGDHSHAEDEHEHEHEHEHESVCGEITVLREYDLGLHIIGAVVLAVASFVGCSMTAISKRQSFIKIPTIIIDIGRHFGSGVILSTGFIHMLMSSVYNLSHECAPKIFKTYSAFPTLIAMIAALVLHLLEYLLLAHFNRDKIEEVVKGSDLIGEEEHGCAMHCSDSLETRITTYILELGILSHSIFIGISLGVTSGTQWVTLLVAIVFHQFFEGIGLGARISDLNFNTVLKPIFMVLSFSITASIGVAIGILIHTSYSDTSPTALVIQGVFDAISAGILIYTALVELIAREISTKSEFVLKSKVAKILCFIALYLGVASMAIIGIWA
ncbi:Zip-domain-containing protein [Neoconidiobolus thromboides FSU 785]|nr:Zip-domain-containing protein [Neoconidiobolus thromboides FSU 785]